MTEADRAADAPIDDELAFALCRKAAANAYAPYSGLRVAAVAIDEAGKPHLGVNVENQSYPVGTCAEEAAIAALRGSGAKGIRRLYLYSEPDIAIVPCGACRQRLAEFDRPDLPIVVFDAEGRATETTLEALFPASFRFR